MQENFSRFMLKSTAPRKKREKIDEKNNYNHQLSSPEKEEKKKRSKEKASCYLEQR